VKDLEDDEAWAAIAYNIALGLSNIAALIQPDTIILGGPVGHYLSKYQHHLDSAMQKLKEKMYAIPDIVQAVHPEEAVIHGCYHLLKDSEHR
jgi:predicted NBD/HSP70 family sugar kinase